MQDWPLFTVLALTPISMRDRIIGKADLPE
jgi:hypothetical protein